MTATTSRRAVLAGVAAAIPAAIAAPALASVEQVDPADLKADAKLQKLFFHLESASAAEKTFYDTEYKRASARYDALKARAVSHKSAAKQSGLKAAEARWEKLDAESHRVYLEMMRERAATFHGVRLKIRAAEITDVDGLDGADFCKSLIADLKKLPLV